MGKKYGFNYIIIGSGPAGSAAALTLAKSKKGIAIVEGRFFGGSNLSTRDIPYASTLESANTFFKAETAVELAGSDLTLNLPVLINRELKSAVDASNANKKALEDAGVKLIKGFANFLDAHTIAVGNEKYTAENFILATGAKLNPGDIAGLETVNYLTPETAIHIRRLPKVALIIGGGSTGVEIAEYYAKLGTKAILMEAKPRILPREDKEVSEVITKYLTDELGVMVLPSCKVVALEQSGANTRVIFKNNSAEKMVHLDCVVLATGSKPALDYGLENAGVKYKPTGIIVDKFFSTSAKNIHAIGDCIDGITESSTDRSNFEGTLLASNIASKSKALRNYAGIIRTVKTNPAVATVGKNENDLILSKVKYKKALIPLSNITISYVEKPHNGFVKLLLIELLTQRDKLAQL